MVAAIGVVLLYFLLILFGQFVAQGVVEEKSSRVVELLLATMRPWQLLAGKILGLGVLGLAQILLIAVVGTSGALAFGVVTLPGQLIGTVVSVLRGSSSATRSTPRCSPPPRPWSAGRRTSGR